MIKSNTTVKLLRIVKAGKPAVCISSTYMITNGVAVVTLLRYVITLLQVMFQRVCLLLIVL